MTRRPVLMRTRRRTALLGLALSVVIGGAALAPPVAYAQSSQCGYIRDADDRALCRAKTAGSSGQCGYIGDADKRSYCRAVTGGGTSQCGYVRDGDLRNVCRAETAQRPSTAGSAASECGYVQDADQRAACRARTSGNASHCGYVEDADQRAYCRAVAGARAVDDGIDFGRLHTDERSGGAPRRPRCWWGLRKPTSDTSRLPPGSSA